MSLEILHNRAEHTHENEQFRRVALELRDVFAKNNWSGILIGNPFNENFYRFRADALLCYDYGLILIDFKDYKGTINLPPNDDEFHNLKWYTESEKDKTRIEIKAGSRFINPFRQLKAYREAFYEIVQKSIYLTENINPSRVAIVNIFSGPIETKNEVPGSLRYYKIVQENQVANFLYDFASENKFTYEIADNLKAIFPASSWEIEKRPEILTFTERNDFKKIENNVEIELSNFLSDNNSGVFVLESLDVIIRDTWMKYILSETPNFGIPETELWAHSSRICKKITDRTRIGVNSVYKMIYGGSNAADEDDSDKDSESEDANVMEIIPIKSSVNIDKNALIILHEAHLINRSLNQSDLLRFGTGRLLEDIIKFVNFENCNRKIIFIGDPYSLSFGKNEDAALNIDTLQDLFSGKIKHYREPLNKTLLEGKKDLVFNLAQSIEKKLFNHLEYKWNAKNLNSITKQNVEITLKDWFSKPETAEPTRAILMYSKHDARKTNLWIKNNCLRNSSKLAKGDLLVANNNTNIPDNTGFNQPKKVINGMYFTLNRINETVNIPIIIKQSVTPINLSFLQINVKCLNLSGVPEADVWMLENYFISEGTLSKEEKIAFRIMINRKLNEQKNKNPFSESSEFKILKQDKEYIKLSDEEKEAIEIIAKNYNLPKGKKISVKTNNTVRKKILAKYKSKYDRRLLAYIRESDPFVNALLINYGWALTVHKALGSAFEETIINTYQGEAKGITNEDYFRWLYTSISTTEKNVWIINPQEINPMMNCQFEDSTVSIIEKTEAKKVLLTFPNPVLPENILDKIKQVTNKNVLAIINLLVIHLEPKGYVFEIAELKSGFLTKIYFSISKSVEKKCVLNIDNKGEKENYAVSNIRIDKLEEGDQNLIEEIITNLFKDFNPSKNRDKLQFPEDFRNEIYNNWLNKLNVQGFSLNLVESHNNQDIFIAYNENIKIKFKVWYGTSEIEKTKGFINKIVIMGKTDATTVDLSQILKSCLL